MTTLCAAKVKDMRMTSEEFRLLCTSVVSYTARMCARENGLEVMLDITAYGQPCIYGFTTSPEYETTIISSRHENRIGSRVAHGYAWTTTANVGTHSRIDSIIQVAP